VDLSLTSTELLSDRQADLLYVATAPDAPSFLFAAGFFTSSAVSRDAVLAQLACRLAGAGEQVMVVCHQADQAETICRAVPTSCGVRCLSTLRLLNLVSGRRGDAHEGAKSTVVIWDGAHRAQTNVRGQILHKLPQRARYVALYGGAPDGHALSAEMVAAFHQVAAVPQFGQRAAVVDGPLVARSDLGLLLDSLGCARV
jgi:hypothetical protein